MNSTDLEGSAISHSEQLSTSSYASLEELIWSYNHRLEDLAIEMVTSFQDMFERERPSVSGGAYRFTEISSSSSLDHLWSGRGFYLILSDYTPPWDRQNFCTLAVGGLPVIYRGQADKVQERLKSHLDNRRYSQKKKEKAHAVWDRCLKLDDVKGNKGGINVDEMPFNCARWAVVVLPMSKSSSQMRELVEWAFDCVFQRPVASNERKQIPHAVKTAIEKNQERYRTMAMESNKALEEFRKLYPTNTASRILR